MRLKGKVAIVTGAGSGIGEATALTFANEGARITVADVVDSAGNDTVEQIRAAGGDAIYVHTDVTSASDIQGMVSATIGNYGKLDVLFNNAGIAMRLAVADLPEEDWDRCIDINLKGAYLGSKYAIPAMKANGSGSIINTASIYGIVGGPNRAAYVASKGGIVNLTRGMALDYAENNIRVNCICPGYTDTPIIQNIVETPDRYKALVDQHPMGRLARPLDIAYG
ncbi:MAG: glucose 1-dehydrogenase, partial [Candidatus Poribacteria bacterium]|nr:glucose 1-dehydrogenase [Candidatus Poribacteria bacterium]